MVLKSSKYCIGPWSRTSRSPVSRRRLRCLPPGNSPDTHSSASREGRHPLSPGLDASTLPRR
eukprot:2557291-Prymnesium_polylepis.1